MKKFLFLFAALFLTGLSHAFAQSAASAQKGVAAVMTDTTSQLSDGGSSTPAVNTSQKNSQQMIAPGTYPASSGNDGQKSAATKEEPATVGPR